MLSVLYFHLLAPRVVLVMSDVVKRVSSKNVLFKFFAVEKITEDLRKSTYE